MRKTFTTVQLRGKVTLIGMPPNEKAVLYPLYGGPGIELAELFKKYNNRDVNIEITSDH